MLAQQMEENYQRMQNHSQEQAKNHKCSLHLRTNNTKQWKVLGNRGERSQTWKTNA